MPRKVCKGCLRELDLDMFHKHSQNGTRPRCKECRSKATKRFGVHSHLIGILEKKNRKLISAGYTKRYPEKSAAKTAKRRSIKKKSSPHWANQFFIDEAYHLASLRTKTLGFKWEVDHIIPLQGKNVCGLHVENNLQVIPKISNIRKGNKFCPGV